MMILEQEASRITKLVKEFDSQVEAGQENLFGLSDQEIIFVPMFGLRRNNDAFRNLIERLIFIDECVKKGGRILYVAFPKNTPATHIVAVEQLSERGWIPTTEFPKLPNPNLDGIRFARVPNSNRKEFEKRIYEE